MVRFTLTQVFLLWVLGFGTLAWCTRRRVAALARRTHLPRVLNYYLLVTPVILLEEALTIEVPYFWGILPMLLAFYILFLPLYLVQRYSRCSFVLASLLFGAMGCANEFLVVGRIRQVDEWQVLVILNALCFLIYAVMALWPTYYLEAALAQTAARPGPAADAP